MAKRYIAVNTTTGLFYKQGRFGGWTKDIREARIFGRRCDAHNAVHKSIVNLIEIDLDPNMHYRVYCGDTAGDCFRFKARDFDNLEEAEKYKEDSASLASNIKIAFLPGRLYPPLLTVAVERPSWENYFFGLAVTAAKRSHDIHTQVGAVIADKNHHVVGIGYNGFPKGMKDNTLPLDRPAKYQWMVHAEMNAITNCLYKPEDCTAYLTLSPCGDCAIHMWQNGIREIVYDQTTDCTKKEWFKPDVLEKLREDTGMIIRGVTPDLSWL